MLDALEVVYDDLVNQLELKSIKVEEEKQSMIKNYVSKFFIISSVIWFAVFMK